MLQEVAQLVKVAKHASSLIDYVESGGVASILAEIELSAAAAAFRNVKIAKNRESHIWSAITHLESSYQALLKVIKSDEGSLKRLWIGHVIKHAERVNKCELVLCIIILLYKLLDEHEICNKYSADLAYLYDARLSPKYKPATELLLGPVFVTTFIAQAICFIATKEKVYITSEQIEDIKRIITND